MPGTGRMAMVCQASKAACGGDVGTETLYPWQHDLARGSPGMKSKQRMAPMLAPCNWSALATALHPCGVSPVSARKPPGRLVIPETSNGAKGFSSCIIHILKGVWGVFKKKKKKALESTFPEVLVPSLKKEALLVKCPLLVPKKIKSRAFL